VKKEWPHIIWRPNARSPLFAIQSWYASVLEVFVRFYHSAADIRVNGMTDDAELLRQYVSEGSERAFEELVRRHLPLVYSAALRQLGGDEAMAKDVAQTVFIDLARKARCLLDRELLTGWLYVSTRLVVSNSVRAEMRRRRREGIAVGMQENSLMPSSDAGRAELSQVLDEAMSQLEPEERDAVLLRFFQSMGLKEVGMELGISEDAARMRINRSLGRLHLFINRRGLAVSAATLGAVLAAESVSAVPQGLAASISGVALAGAASSATSLTAAKMIMISKMKLSVLCALAIAGVAAPLAVHHRSQLQLGQKEQLLQRQADGLAQLASDNEQLSNQLAQANESLTLANDQLRELLKLRNEVGMLRQENSDLGKLRQQTEELRAVVERGRRQGTPIGAKGGLAPPDIKNFGVVEISDGTPTPLDLGADKECFVTGTMMDDGMLQAVFTTKSVVDGVPVHTRLVTAMKPGLQVICEVDGDLISLTPKIKEK
jgi:RNA polymerase sigma factor (sigma-70 family)